MNRLALRPLGALLVSVLIATAASAADAPNDTATDTPAAPAIQAAQTGTPASEAPAAAVPPVVTLPPEPKKPDVTLRFGTINTPTQATYKNNLVPLVEAIERDSTGRIKIELGELNKFGRPPELLPKLEKGEIDMAATVQGYHPGRFPRSEVMELPLIFPTAAAGTEAMWKLYEEGLIAEDYKTLKVLSLYVLPPYSVFFADHKVESPRQLRGVSVRAPSRTIGEALDRLGMVPLGLPFNVSGDYVAQGLLEAVNLTWDTVQTTKVGKDSVLVNHVRQGLDLRFAAPALMIVMNKARYDAMPEDLRKIIDKHTGRDFTMAMASSRDAANAEARDRFAKEPGKQVYELKPEHRREIAERIEPVIAKWAAEKKAAGIDSQALLTRVRALVAANEKR
jgi:TRAP-type transport system periplasmic protein